MGKSSKTKVGYHYRPAYHVGLCRGVLDAFLEFRAADKTAWAGSLEQSGRIYINRPQLFGGESDQGGIVGPVDVMFGEPGQQPNAYLRGVFGTQVTAWSGLATLAFCGGRFGAMNPMPQRPAYKLRKIINGWSSGDETCWYPEKAEVYAPDLVILPARSDGWEYQQLPYHESPGYEQLVPPADGWQAGTAPFGDSWTWPGQPAPVTLWQQDTILWIRRTITVPNGRTATARVRAENGCVLFLNGTVLGAANRDNVQLMQGDVFDFVLPPGTHELLVKSFDEHPTQGDTYLSVEILGLAVRGMNGAHALYYVCTDSEKGREPRELINDASLRAAADMLHAEGFGLCWEYDPSRDTPDGFNERICRIIGGSFERSITDGMWYLDLARGGYEIDTLPTIGDDDILQFREQPTTLDRAVNSISVRYFDPERKESVITPAVRALGLIRQFGEIHETLDMPEIPTGPLALIVAERELRARITPSRTFELVTTPRPRAIRRNQYFRLQSPKRGILDMVCIVGEKQAGTLRSGAMTWKVAQDVYSLPTATYTEIEDGVDTRPPQIARPIQSGVAFEAPYVDVVASIPTAELAALSPEAGFLMAAADDPGQHLDFTVAVRPAGGEFSFSANGDWVATATVVGETDRSRTVFEIENAARMEAVSAGMAVVLDSEWCRVDAIDLAASPATLTLGRGCADTLPGLHAAGARLWVLTGAEASVVTEFTEGETVDVKLLSNTGSERQALEVAPTLPLTFMGRQARPYPPASMRLNGSLDPDVVAGELEVSWLHRDRLGQADQLFDATHPSIGPEPGVTYNVRWFLNGALAHSDLNVSGSSSAWTPGGSGVVRVEVESERDGLVSLHRAVLEASYGELPPELHTYTADGLFTAPVSGDYDVLLVGAGGGGGGYFIGGGGGGGQVRRETIYLTAGTHLVTVGKGGLPGDITTGAGGRGKTGGSTFVGSHAALGGCGGGGEYTSSLTAPNDGWSGGGGAGRQSQPGSSGVGGFAGGRAGLGDVSNTGGGGGGGGAGGVGGDGSSTGPATGTGGLGVTDDLSGVAEEFGGGGGGGCGDARVARPGSLGMGGGGNGGGSAGSGGPLNATPGRANSGGGGGGGGARGGSYTPGARGADGFVAIRGPL